MKLRLAPEHIRYRISRSEFDRLITSSAIRDQLCLSSALKIHYQIILKEQASSPEDKLMDFEASPTAEGINLNLTLYSHVIDLLELPEHAKHGVKEFLTFDNGEMLTITVEIDMDRRSSN